MKKFVFGGLCAAMMAISGTAMAADFVQERIIRLLPILAR
jgi:hypothetical protein